MSRIWYIVLALVTTPYIVTKLGTDAYGILSITLTLVGYFSLTEIGMGNTLVKYLSEYLASKSEQKVEKLVQTAFIYYALIGIVGSILIALFTPLMTTRVINVPQELHRTTRIAFYITGASFFFNMMVTFLGSVLRGYQRFELMAIRNIGVHTVSIVSTVSLLSLGYGLVSIVALNFLVRFVNSSIFFVIAKRLLGTISLVPRWDRSMFNILFHFSKWKFMGGISSKVAYSFDRVLIASLVNVSQLTYYMIPLNLSQMIGKRLIGVVNQVIYPFMSESVTIDTFKDQKELYFRSLKWIMMLLSPATLYLMVFGDKFLFYWIGEEFSRRGSLILYILCISYFLGTLVYNDSVYFEAKGNSKLPNLVASGSMLIIVVLDILLLPLVGIVGAAIGFSVATISTGIYMKHRTLYRMLDSGWSEFFRVVILKPGIALIMASVVLFPLRLVGNHLFYYFFFVPITGLTAFLLFLLCGCFDDRDKEIIRSFILKITPQVFKLKFGKKSVS